MQRVGSARNKRFAKAEAMLPRLAETLGGMNKPLVQLFKEHAPDVETKCQFSDFTEAS